MIVCRYQESFDDTVVAALLAEVGPQDALLVLLPEAEAGRVAWLQARLGGLGLRLAGAVFPLLIYDEELVDRGVLFLILRHAPPPRLLGGVGDPREVAGVAANLTHQVEEALSPEQEASLFCIFDALVPNIHTLLDACYLELADRVRYFGVNAGSETFETRPCLFDAERFIAGGLLSVLLPRHPGAALVHGYPQPEHLVAATSAKGNRIVQIDWRPAVDVYRELIASQYGVVVTQENFYPHAVNFPFGIVRADGELLVRLPVALDEEGGIVCIGEIPPNAVLTLLDARSVAADTPARLVSALCELGEARDAGDMLMFYCAGRRMQKGEAGVRAELRAVRADSGATHLDGALSLGEIGGAASGGYPLFHNATLVGVPCRIR